MLATTNLDPKLHLIDFAQATPEYLSNLIKEELAKVEAHIDKLEQTPNASSSEQALADIKAFYHADIGLSRAWGVLSHLNSVMSNDDIRHTYHALLPAISSHSTRVGQTKALFNRYQMIKQDEAFFVSLPQARKRAIELALQDFELSGIGLPTDKQAEFAKITSQLSELSAKFSDNILDATQAFALPLTDSQVSGISESGLAMLAQAGEQYKQKLEQSGDKTAEQIKQLPTPYYVATLDIPVYLAVMTYADDRNLREQMYKAFVTRASEFDEHINAKGESLNNADNMVEILALRAKKASLLGMKNYAELSLSTKMANSVNQVTQFLRKLAQKAMPFAKADVEALTQAAFQHGFNTLQPWDTAYLAEKIKQEKFNLSQEEIRPYFPLQTVIEGMFTIVNRLYGIKVVEHSQDVSLWHEDVRFYQLFDTNDDGEARLIGGFYFDLYARQGKRGGAWMSGFQPKYINEEQNYEQLPACYMVGNFSPPTRINGNEKPSLLTHNEVTTLFHEFGHGLHHLLSQVTVGDVSGINGVEWDAVELPSQFMENWAWDSEGIALISCHEQTGESLPDKKLKALLDAKNFQSGMQTLRQIEFALFDILLHAESPTPDYLGLLALLDSVRDEVAVMHTPHYNRFANGFSHIFAGGYAAGYYSYKWAELLSADAFGKFEEEGIFNKKTGKRFRDNILAVGGSLPAKINFENFRGREATVDALLRHSGFVK
ncbi:MAG: oligopeptidase A [Gammaproteobacteria bacterium]|nr:MAG: oligopeptidase A [Gammaproteobacteria bacterium]